MTCGKLPSDLCEEFTDDIFHMREYATKIRYAEDAFGVSLWEGLVGNLFDELFEIKLMPYVTLAEENQRDDAIENLYDLVFEIEDPDDEACISYCETYLKGCFK